MMGVLPKIRGNSDNLKYHVFNNRDDMGKYASNQVVQEIIRLLKKKDEIRMIFAAAPSQNEFLSYLVSDKRIDWSRVVGFHMDEYIGLNPGNPQQFQSFLRKNLFEKVSFKKVHLIQGHNDLTEECERYGSLIREHPIDIVCLGVGENGHIAFNDPPVADFEDNEIMKVVELDTICRRQQVNDGCFGSFDEVPTHALTLTIPTLLSANRMDCIVPGKTKASAVQTLLQGEITTECPASILRKHENAQLYLDLESFGDVL